MNEGENVTNCCRTCLKMDCSLISTSAEDTDSLKYCQKLSSCISEIVSTYIVSMFYTFGINGNISVNYVGVIHCQSIK